MSNPISPPADASVKLAPANMVGGRRVDTGHREYAQVDAVKEAFDQGLPAKMDRAYPTEAVKKVHDKPTPAVQPPFVNRGGPSGGQQRFMPQKTNH